MKKHTLAWAALCFSVLMLTGCALFAQQSRSAAEEDTLTLDPLTGEAARWPGQRPAAVFIDNGPEASRQWGIGEASVVFEALTEGENATSLCLVYPSLEAVPKTGPVAQGRDLYLQLLACQQVIPIQRGATVYAANFEDYYEVLPLDALSLGIKGFTYEGVWGQPDQISWTTSGADLLPLADSAGVSLHVQPKTDPSSADSDASGGESTAKLPPLLPFGETANGKEGASSVELIFSPSSSTHFTYDEGTGQYLMARSDGSPQTDANTSTQAGFDNLLILYSAPSLRDDGYCWGYDLTMGAGVYLNGGSVWSILWMPGVDSTLAIYNSDGTALNIHPGTSYIALMGSVAGQEVILRDSQGTEMTAN